MTRHFLTFMLVTIVVFDASCSARGGRERLSLDWGWRFHAGDVAGANVSPEGVAITRWRWKADGRGEADAPEMATLNLNTDGADWQDAAPGQDTFRGRVGFSWYRATLGEAPGPHRTLYFEGVDDNATVYLNGRKLLHHEGWDEPFEVSLDGAWREDGPNVLAVLVENTNGPGGIARTVLQGSEAKAKAGGAASPDFDDRDWRVVDAPHDYVVEGTFDPKADKNHGFLPAGIGWYRRIFLLPASDKDRRLWIDFDGVYRNSRVWLNGHLLGTHLSGYTSFRYDITDVANYGGKNVLAVRVDASRFEGWWYEGGGIYRHVWLNKSDPLHVAPWGVFVTSTVEDPITHGRAAAEVVIKTTIVNQGRSNATCKLVSRIESADSKSIAIASTEQTIASGADVEVAQRASVHDANLWSIESPCLYRLITLVQKNGQTVDRVETPFGIRTIRFDPDHGFFLNGKPVKIKGTCNHQDFAGVGIGMPDRIHVYRVEKLKEMGSNAWRCSHNPPAPELLDACDRLGMVVMDENRRLGDSPEILSQVESMVLRDRNHPSIVMWSLCNEEWLQGTEKGATMASAMKEVIRRLDPTRPVTAAMNGGWGSGLTHVCDLQGFNYSPHMYDGFHKDHPRQPVFASETASTVTTRGVYATDNEKGYVDCYPGGSHAEGAWRPLAEREFTAGGFVWTGIDYKGEPTPFGWPCINSHFGIMDLCGFPKDDYYYYQSWWSDKTVLRLLPHWNWPGKEGQEIEVQCFSNCDAVELFVNGKSQGKKDVPRNSHATWKVRYEPGVLSARGFRNGEEIASSKVETTGPPAAITLSPDRKTIKADGEDVSLIAVSIADAQGRTVPTADNEVSFGIGGTAKIIGVGNGDPSDHDPDKESKRKAFNGLCMVLVQAGTQQGDIQLTAKSPGLTSATVILRAVRAPLRPRVR